MSTENKQESSQLENNQSNVEDQELDEQELADAGVAIPPDGGYGWVIVAGSFFLNAIFDGVIYTQGKVLIPAWIESFNIPYTAASFTFSILTGFYYMAGPLASAFCNVFGCRKVALAGSVTAAVGFLLSLLVNNVYYLYVTFGLVAGMGFGMMYLPSIVVISQYFAKKRSLATGIAVCGSGIGTTILPVINDVVFEQVNKKWRPFLIYTTGITLLGIFAALLLRPLQPKKKKQIKKPDVTIVEETIHEESDQKKSLLETVANDADELNKPLNHLDVFYAGSTGGLMARSRANSIDANRGESEADEATIFIQVSGKKEAKKEKKSISEDIFDALKSLLDKSLLHSYTFLLLAFSGTMTLTCFYVPFIYLGNHLDKIEGLTTFQKSFPISLIGMVNIGSRVLCGYISDHPKVSALVVNNVALFVAGLATMAVPFFTQYWQFVAYCFPFAFGVAVFAALRSVICVELLGVEKLNNGFGILMLFMGFGAVIGSPIAAVLKDVTGNFDASFYIMGAMMALSGIVCIPLAKLRRWELMREQRQQGIEMKSTNPQ